MRKRIHGSAGTASSVPLTPNPANVPATVEACKADYANRNAAQIGANPRAEQQGQAQISGNESAGFWRGRRR